MDDIQSMLQDSANSLFKDIVTSDALQKAENGGFQTAMWNAVADQGFTLAMRSDDNGGSGMSWEQLYPLVHAAGRYTVPLPLVETLLANYLLEKAGCAETNKDTILTLASAPADAIEIQGARATLKTSLTNVPFARHAERLVLVAEIDSVPHIGWIELKNKQAQGSPAMTIQTELNIAREPRDILWLTDSPILEWRPAPKLGLNPLMRYGAMMRSAQMAGAIERVLDLSLAYSTERIQFGRALAKFQVIQHHIAELGCEAAASTVAAAYAFEQADHSEANLAIAAAKIRTGQAASKAASLAHAVHGAIGFSYEHSLQYATRRLWSWRSEYGSHGWWALRLGQAVCAASPESWWSIATSGELSVNLSAETIHV